MRHRRHGRHAAKSTGSCMGMLAAAVAFGLLNMGSVSAAEPTRPDAGTLQQDLQTKKNSINKMFPLAMLISRSSRSSARASTCRIP